MPANGGDAGAAGWVSQIERDTHELLGAVERLSTDVSLSLRESVDRRPIAALGLGFLGGYVLGGGLTLRLATLLLATAARALVANAVAGAMGERRTGDREE